MTPQEIEHFNNKSKLRQEAIDKEVQRLRKINKTQSNKITNLRKALYFQLFFFVSLIAIFIIKGMISFKSTSSSEEFEAYKLKYDDLQKANNTLDDSLDLYRNKLSSIISNNLETRNESGIKFRVQIGAFKEINLSDFEDNLVAINQEKYDSINQYTIGEFNNYAKAQLFLEDIKRMGFNDSFIISTKNGRRIPIEKLTKEELGLQE